MSSKPGLADYKPPVVGVHEQDLRGSAPARSNRSSQDHGRTKVRPSEAALVASVSLVRSTLDSRLLGQSAYSSVQGPGAAIVATVAMKATRSQSMHTHCVRYMPIARAAPRVRSSVTPRVNGPRSLITTVTDLPFSGFVTVTRDPKGIVRCAAAYPLGSNLSPLAVRRPEA